MWTFDDAVVDDPFVAKRIEAAVARRRSLDDVTNATRLVYSESDGIPGLIVDRYDDVAVVQFTAATSERWRNVIVDVCRSLDGINSVFERSDLDVRKLEGLSPNEWTTRRATNRRHTWRSSNIGCRYLVDVRRGHKTGFYLDQRDNRRLVAGRCEWLSRLELVLLHRRILRCRRCVAARASVVSVDSSAQALGDRSQQCRPQRRHRCRMGQGRRVSRICANSAMPEPSSISSCSTRPSSRRSAAQVRRAARGYKDLNWLAFRCSRPGAIFATFSCSGLVDSDLFTKVVAGWCARCAAARSPSSRHLDQAGDHPVPAVVPGKRVPQGFVVPG
jgi:23S rRNA (cytosine1962-C5)-methyltransferase